MKFHEVSKHLAGLPVFKLTDLQKFDPSFRQQYLARWKKQGLIRMICRGHYVLAGYEPVEDWIFAIGNSIYKPSCVSVESALSYYGIIPEVILAVTSVSTRKTCRINSEFGMFIFHTIKPAFFFGYKSIQGVSGNSFLIADPEKAIVDYLYLHPGIKSDEDFAEMRIDEDIAANLINHKKLLDYSSRFRKKALSTRVNIFLKVVLNA